METIQKHSFKILLFLTAFVLTVSSCSTTRRLERKATSMGGVEINGTIWATTNVGANNPEDFGNYHTWYESQNICPAGWRVPTIEEIESLVEADSEWTRIRRVNGRKFGSGNNTIFLPASGWRDNASSARRSNVGTHGYYWSRSQSATSGLYSMSFTSNDAWSVSWGSRHIRLSVRCVAE